MDRDNLVSMANRIASFFEGTGTETEAQEEVRNHLRKFWAPAMRAELLAEIDAGGAAGLHPLVRAAVARFRSELLPPSA